MLGRDSVSYHAVAQGNGFHAANPNHALVADFTPQGVDLRAGTARWALALSGYGYGQALSSVTTVAPQASANRVEYRRGALTEWYVNGPLALEQGFTLEAPPGPRPSGEALTLALGLSGDLQPTRDADGASLTLRQADGTTALRYGGLTAYDAAGRELPVGLEMQGGSQLRLRVDDTGARYPLVIDPLVQTETGRAKLTASDGASGDWFGFPVAISGDTVVVGARFNDVGGNSDQGSAYVFVKPGRGWSGRLTETAKLIASGGTVFFFGTSVAISGDTVVVGAENSSAYVFVEPTGGWGGTLTETAKLIASDVTFLDAFGFPVAISADTVVAGAYLADIDANTDQGSAYVFVKPTGGWGGNVTETAKLTASDGAANDYFGTVAISGDTVVVGAQLDDIGGNASQGSAYLFAKPVGGWGGNLTEDAKLTAQDGAAIDLFGYSVAVTGRTVVVGAWGDDIGSNFDQGSAYVFDRRE